VSSFRGRISLVVVLVMALAFLNGYGCVAPTSTTYSSISGAVSLSGTGLQGVTMTLAGASSGTVTTNASGGYSFTGLTDGSYTITPNKSGYDFSPPSSAQTLSGADITGVNFAASPLTYSISGAVSLSGTALQGVNMTLAGASSETVTTNASGGYSFTGLANGSYTITPDKFGYDFSPSSSAQTLSGADITAVNFAASAHATYTNPAVYLVTRTFTVNNTDTPIAQLRVWLPGVVTWDSQTDVGYLQITPNPSSVLEQEYGSALYWELYNEPAQGSSLVITDQFKYTCWAVDYEIDPSQVGAYNETSADYQLFTRPGRFIQSDDIEIRELAGELQQGRTNPYDTARSIYNWVRDNLTFKAGLGQGAKHALENRWGNCADYSTLFCALCRAAGIPARTIVGHRVKSFYCGAPDSDQGFHVWAEFYLPGYGWVPVDANEESMDPTIDCFGKLDNRRLIYQKDPGLVLPSCYGCLAGVGGVSQSYVWGYTAQGSGGATPPKACYAYSFTQLPPLGYK
jgi:transglutaminase-like putative cysteine protease